MIEVDREDLLERYAKLPEALADRAAENGADVEGVAREHKRGLAMQAPSCVGQLAGELKSLRNQEAQLEKEREKLTAIKNTTRDAAQSKERLTRALSERTKKAVAALVTQDAQVNDRNEATLITEMTAAQSLRALHKEFDTLQAAAWKEVLKGRVTEQEQHIAFAESQLAESQKRLAWNGWERLSDENAPEYFKVAVRPNKQGKAVCDACRVLFDKELVVGSDEWVNYLVMLHHVLTEENAKKRGEEQRRNYPAKQEDLSGMVDGGPGDIDTMTAT